MLRKREYYGEIEMKTEITFLFETAFPEDERPPVKYFFKSLEREENRLFAYYLGTTFIGFAFITLYKDICYLFFLAVSQNYRHQGYGGEILEDIKSTYHDCVILLCYEEVDQKYPNYEERVTRRNFYQKHGFKENKLKTNEYGVIFETAYIGSHQVDFMTYKEIFALGFGEQSKAYISEVK